MIAKYLLLQDTSFVRVDKRNFFSGNTSMHLE